MQTILFTGDGSAGHVTPNLTLIKKFQTENWQTIYAGSADGIEKNIISRINIPYYSIASGKLRRHFSWQNFLSPFKVIQGIAQAFLLCKKLKPQIVFSKGGFSGHDSWFSLRETTIYIFSLAAYIIAYVGFFVATVLTHFVWTILYVWAPLMILMYISRHTAYVTMSLYKGLVQVVLWKILWSILGVLLLKLAMQPQVSGMEDYLMAIVMNLCIGVSMLFIPLATKSLISDGMSSVASTLAMAPALAMSGAVKVAASRFGSKAATGMKSAAGFMAKPATNLVSGRAELLKDRLKPRFESFKNNYEKIGLPKESRCTM